MTEQEFKRYEKAVEIKNKINYLESFIEYLDTKFDNNIYPRSESKWQLSVLINDETKTINLTSDLFWECVDYVEKRKKEELEKYKEVFNNL